MVPGSLGTEGFKDFFPVFFFFFFYNSLILRVRQPLRGSWNIDFFNLGPPGLIMRGWKRLWCVWQLGGRTQRGGDDTSHEKFCRLKNTTSNKIQKTPDSSAERRHAVTRASLHFSLHLKLFGTIAPVIKVC